MCPQTWETISPLTWLLKIWVVEGRRKEENCSRVVTVVRLVCSYCSDSVSVVIREFIYDVLELILSSSIHVV